MSVDETCVPQGEPSQAAAPSAASSPAPRPAMVERTVRLCFALGDIPVVRKALRVLVPEKPLEATVPADQVAALLAAAPAAVRGVYLPGMPIEDRLPRTVREQGLLRYVVQQYQRCYVDLGGTYEQHFQANFSGKTRSTLKRKVKKLAEHCQGRMELRVYRTAQEVTEFHGLATALSARTYQHRVMDAGLPTSASFVERMTALAAENRVRAFLLFCGERPISYLYCPAAESILSYGYLGYDPEFADLSPGTVLHLMALESLFAEGRFSMLDFDQGQGQHKEMFASVKRLCANVYYLRPRLSNRVLVALHGMTASVSTGVGRALAAVGVKKLVKRLIRRSG